MPVMKRIMHDRSKAKYHGESVREFLLNQRPLSGDPEFERDTFERTQRSAREAAEAASLGDQDAQEDPGMIPGEFE